MKKFYIDYISKIDGDVTHVWLYARSKEHAKNEVKHEYWDVQEMMGRRRTKLLGNHRPRS